MENCSLRLRINMYISAHDNQAVKTTKRIWKYFYFGKPSCMPDMLVEQNRKRIRLLNGQQCCHRHIPLASVWVEGETEWNNIHGHGERQGFGRFFKRPALREQNLNTTGIRLRKVKFNAGRTQNNVTDTSQRSVEDFKTILSLLRLPLLRKWRQRAVGTLINVFWPFLSNGRTELSRTK